MNFRKTFPFDRGYVYLGRYVFEKLQGMGGGTLIWVGSFIWQWIVPGVGSKVWVWSRGLLGVAWYATLRMGWPLEARGSLFPDWP